MNKILCLAFLGLMLSSCQSLQPKFGKICIKLEKEKLNYTINSDFQDSFFQQRSIDYFDWYFLHYFDNQIINKGYQTDARGCSVWYEIKAPGFDIYGLKNKNLQLAENRNFNLKFMYADFGAKFSSDKNWFIQVNDSIPEVFSFLDYRENEILPVELWMKEKQIKRTADYAYLPLGFNDGHLQQLAFRMANKIAEKTDSIISYELKNNPDLIQKIYHPGKAKK